jgi:gamma-glutamylcyclotransferase
MLSTRLRARCPSARLVAVAYAPKHTIRFEKLSVDASGKATLVASGDERALAAGAVYELDVIELPRLDEAEGDGYARRDNFSVHSLDTGERMRVCTYIAKRRLSRLRPYDWYLALVLAGIAEHDLGRARCPTVGEQAYDVDPSAHRPTRLAALEAMRAAGIRDYRALLSRDRAARGAPRKST